MSELTDKQIAELLAQVTIPEPQADRRKVFKCFLPGAICISVILGSWIIERTYPHGDSRNFSGPCVAVVMLPVGLIFGFIGIREGLQPSGFKAIIWGLGWNALLAFGPWLLFLAVIKFGIAKHL